MTEKARILRWLVGQERARRAAGSLLGRYWGLLLPPLEAAVFTVVFGLLLYVRGSPADYLLFAYPGLLAWRVFARSASSAAGCFRGQAPLLHTFPAPAYLLPVAVTLDAFRAGLAGLPVFLILILALGEPPSAGRLALWLPVAGGLHLAAAAGISLLVAVGSAFYRDVASAVRPGFAGLMFLTPVVYPAELVPDAVRPAFLANPMAAAIEAYRAAFIGASAVPPESLTAAVLLAGALLVLGFGATARYGLRLREVIG